MRESEIRERLETKAKNIQFLKKIIKEYESIKNPTTKDEYEYTFAELKLSTTNCLEDEITEMRILHEMRLEKENNEKESINLYRVLISTAIKEMEMKNFIYFIDNRYSFKDKINQKRIISYLINNYYRNKAKFGYISRADFKFWVQDVFTEMNYSFTKNSINSQIEQLL